VGYRSIRATIIGGRISVAKARTRTCSSASSSSCTASPSRIDTVSSTMRTSAALRTASRSTRTARVGASVGTRLCSSAELDGISVGKPDGADVVGGSVVGRSVVGPRVAGDRIVGLQRCSLIQSKLTKGARYSQAGNHARTSATSGPS
jgi:hypothetical protein